MLTTVLLQFQNDDVIHLTAILDDVVHRYAMDNSLPFESKHDASDIEEMVEVAVGMYVDYARDYLLGEDAAVDADIRWWLPRCEALIRSTYRAGTP